MSTDVIESPRASWTKPSIAWVGLAVTALYASVFYAYWTTRTEYGIGIVLLFLPCFLLALLLPVLLGVDAWRVRSSDHSWGPQPVFWAAAGLVPVVVAALFDTGAVLALAAVPFAYLLRRHRRIGVP